MRKPVSKHALRRAMERAQAEGLIQFSQPAGNVVDHVWREIEKQAFDGGRKKPVGRETIRDPGDVELVDVAEAAEA